MPITQIPFQDPVAPPPEEPQQLGLYDKTDWETAYRELDERVPHLLIQLQDDLERSRRREAAWISLVVHLILLIIVWNFAFIQAHLWHSRVVLPLNDSRQQKDVTFLALPPDLQKAPHKPSNIISDKDRIAMSPRPQLDPKDLKKMLASPPPGAGTPGPRAPQPAPAPAAPQQAPQQAAPQQRPPDNNQVAQMHLPPQPQNNNEFSKYAGSLSAGSAIQQAARGAAAAKQAGGGSGDAGFGLGTGAHGHQEGALTILSDTQGVDFGPYLQRILQDVKENWYHLIPESAEMKKGKLAIEFAITKDGKVAGMKLVASSGDVYLDRPAWGSITASDPFPPLPSEFQGQYLALRFRFYYNPDKTDLE